jgi:hypothetical protein
MSKALALALVLVVLTASSIILAMPVSGTSGSENTWTTKAPMPTPRAMAGIAVTPDGKVYVIGGYSASQQQYLSVIQKYDPDADT